MEPARLGLLLRVAATSALAGMSLAPPGHAQAVLETPQQANERIRQMSANLRMMPHDYVIGAGDLLNIYVFDVEEIPSADHIVVRHHPQVGRDLTNART